MSNISHRSSKDPKKKKEEEEENSLTSYFSTPLAIEGDTEEVTKEPSGLERTDLLKGSGHKACFQKYLNPVCATCGNGNRVCSCGPADGFLSPSKNSGMISNNDSTSHIEVVDTTHGVETECDICHVNHGKLDPFDGKPVTHMTRVCNECGAEQVLPQIKQVCKICKSKKLGFINNIIDDVEGEMVNTNEFYGEVTGDNEYALNRAQEYNNAMRFKNNQIAVGGIGQGLGFPMLKPCSVNCTPDEPNKGCIKCSKKVTVNVETTDKDGKKVIEPQIVEVARGYETRVTALGQELPVWDVEVGTYGDVGGVDHNHMPCFPRIEQEKVKFIPVPCNLVGCGMEYAQPVPVKKLVDLGSYGSLWSHVMKTKPCTNHVHHSYGKKEFKDNHRCMKEHTHLVRNDNDKLVPMTQYKVTKNGVVPENGYPEDKLPKSFKEKRIPLYSKQACLWRGRMYSTLEVIGVKACWDIVNMIKEQSWRFPVETIGRNGTSHPSWGAAACQKHFGCVPTHIPVKEMEKLAKIVMGKGQFSDNPQEAVATALAAIKADSPRRKYEATVDKEMNFYYNEPLSDRQGWSKKKIFPDMLTEMVEEAIVCGAQYPSQKLEVQRGDKVVQIDGFIPYKDKKTNKTRWYKPQFKQNPDGSWKVVKYDFDRDMTLSTAISSSKIAKGEWNQNPTSLEWSYTVNDSNVSYDCDCFMCEIEAAKEAAKGDSQ